MSDNLPMIKAVFTVKLLNSCFNSHFFIVYILQIKNIYYIIKKIFTSKISNRTLSFDGGAIVSNISISVN